MEKSSTLELWLDHKLTVVQIPGGLQAAHGKGLDGTTDVRSLNFGRSPKHPGKIFVGDAHGNAVIGTPDELFALLRRVAPSHYFVAVEKPKQNTA